MTEQTLKLQASNAWDCDLPLVERLRALDPRDTPTLAAALINDVADEIERMQPMSLERAKEIVDKLKGDYYIEEHREAWNVEGWFTADQLEAIARIMREKT